MKLVKMSNNKQTIKISKKEWTNIGKKAGWMKSARDYPGAGDIGGYPGIPYSEYKHEEEEEEEADPDAATDELKENDIKATLAQIRKGIPLERINTILAKHIILARKNKNLSINDYDFNKEEDLREWASWINYWDHVKHQFPGLI